MSSATDSGESFNYYESLQLTKSLINRSWTRKRFDQAATAAIEGTRKFLDAKQFAPAAELAISMVDSWRKAGDLPDATKVSLVCEFFTRFEFPALADAGPQMNFIKTAIKWAENNNNKCPEFHLILARFYWRHEEYEKANRNYLDSMDSRLDWMPNNINSNNQINNQNNTSALLNAHEEVYEFILKWSEKCNPSELDLIISRIILQLLCLSDLKNANLLFRTLKTNIPAIATGTPIINFIDFLLRTVQRSAAPLFDILQLKYSLAISRDPKFKSYLEQIGAIYFGRVVQKGLLESMLDS